ncbi:MAG: hypothetical protein OWU33_02400, partial [Firmicutes bacterium]|nr:hypothetical protein [Bacillota bacterium]
GPLSTQNVFGLPAPHGDPTIIDVEPQGQYTSPMVSRYRGVWYPDFLHDKRQFAGCRPLVSGHFANTAVYRVPSVRSENRTTEGVACKAHW